LTVVYVTHDQAEAMSMADQVVLLNRGHVEQLGTPRALYDRPATTFAARFIGTPPMNLLALEGGCIAGSASEAPGSSAAAATLGIRPESVTVDPAGLAASVQSTEYLGADLVLRCAIGSQTLLVRTDGRREHAANEPIGLRWAAADAHEFDPAGRRIA
ncbi:MAG TPA: TOBE domain-containing protein, partial [Burkholderiaceae bacterium]|nr:TOBE domain-containing protein [Burkholderiaceae bacterium]